MKTHLDTCHNLATMANAASLSRKYCLPYNNSSAAPEPVASHSVSSPVSLLLFQHLNNVRMPLVVKTQTIICATP